MGWLRHLRPLLSRQHRFGRGIVQTVVRHQGSGSPDRRRRQAGSGRCAGRLGQLDGSDRNDLLFSLGRRRALPWRGWLRGTPRRVWPCSSSQSDLIGLLGSGLSVFVVDVAEMEIPEQAGSGAVGVTEVERTVFGSGDEIGKSSQTRTIQTGNHNGERNVEHASIINGVGELRIDFGGLSKVYERPETLLLQPVEPIDRGGGPPFDRRRNRARPSNPGSLCGEPTATIGGKLVESPSAAEWFSAVGGTTGFVAAGADAAGEGRRRGRRRRGRLSGDVGREIERFDAIEEAREGSAGSAGRGLAAGVERTALIDVFSFAPGRGPGSG